MKNELSSSLRTPAGSTGAVNDGQSWTAFANGVNAARALPPELAASIAERAALTFPLPSGDVVTAVEGIEIADGGVTLTGGEIAVPPLKIGTYDLAGVTAAFGYENGQGFLDASGQLSIPAFAVVGVAFRLDTQCDYLLNEFCMDAEFAGRGVPIGTTGFLLTDIGGCIVDQGCSGDWLISFSAGIIAFTLLLTTTRGETESWFLSTWDFAKQITPLLFAGVLVAGLLLGRPGGEGLIPSGWVNGLVGGNSLWANLFASVVGAFMYFATLTEVPILQGLIGAGMGKGPALALLLAGPALSLPNMLVIRSVMGTKKTVAFVALVVVMATISGLIFGHFF